MREPRYIEACIYEIVQPLYNIIYFENNKKVCICNDTGESRGPGPKNIL